MKRISLFLVLFCCTIARAQLNISTELRQDGTWNTTTEAWDIYATDDSGTLFEFNKELTQFKHTTASITSTYYITEWDYNEEEVKYTMKVKSDVGNEYEMIIDGINNCVCFFYWDEETYVLVRHTIKTSWFNE